MSKFIQRNLYLTNKYPLRNTENMAVTLEIIYSWIKYNYMAVTLSTQHQIIYKVTAMFSTFRSGYLLS